MTVLAETALKRNSQEHEAKHKNSPVDFNMKPTSVDISKGWFQKPAKVFWSPTPQYYCFDYLSFDKNIKSTDRVFFILDILIEILHN